ncbi:MAG: hypothetical protein AAFV27_04925, partial [Pseudomonadota bacterium]
MSEPNSPNHTLDALVAAGVVTHILSVVPEDDAPLDAAFESQIVDQLFGALPEPIMRMEAGRYAVNLATADLETSISELLDPHSCSFEPLATSQMPSAMDAVVARLTQIETTLAEPQSVEWPEDLLALPAQIAEALKQDRGGEDLPAADPEIMAALARLEAKLDVPETADADALTKLVEQFEGFRTAQPDFEAFKQDLLNALPLPDPPPENDAVDQLTTAVATIAERQSAIEKRLDKALTLLSEPKPVDDGPSEALNRIETALGTVAQAVDAPPAGLDALSTTLDEIAGKLAEPVGSEPPVDLSPMVERLDAIQASLVTLANRPASRTEKSLELERMALTRGTTVFETILRRLNAATSDVEERGAQALTQLVERVETSLSTFAEQAADADFATIKLQNTDLAQAVDSLRGELVARPDPTQDLARILTRLDELPAEMIPAVPDGEERTSAASDSFLRLSVAMQSILRRLDTATSAIEGRTGEPPQSAPPQLQAAMDGLISATMAGQDKLQEIGGQISQAGLTTERSGRRSPAT